MCWQIKSTTDCSYQLWILWLGRSLEGHRDTWLKWLHCLKWTLHSRSLQPFWLWELLHGSQDTWVRDTYLSSSLPSNYQQWLKFRIKWTFRRSSSCGCWGLPGAHRHHVSDPCCIVYENPPITSVYTHSLTLRSIGSIQGVMVSNTFTLLLMHYDCDSNTVPRIKCSPRSL